MIDQQLMQMLSSMAIDKNSKSFTPVSIYPGSSGFPSGPPLPPGSAFAQQQHQQQEDNDEDFFLPEQLASSFLPGNEKEDPEQTPTIVKGFEQSLAERQSERMMVYYPIHKVHPLYFVLPSLYYSHILMRYTHAPQRQADLPNTREGYKEYACFLREEGIEIDVPNYLSLNKIRALWIGHFGL